MRSIRWLRAFCSEAKTWAQGKLSKQLMSAKEIILRTGKLSRGDMPDRDVALPRGVDNRQPSPSIPPEDL